MKWKKLGRMAYKAAGYKNPMKKGKLSSSRVVKQVPKLVRDVTRLASMVNAEKKRYVQASSTDNFIAQLNGNSSGHFLLDVTPNISQGVGYNQKTGNSFKWHSFHSDLQFTSQGSCISGIKCRIQLIQIVGQPLTTVSDMMGKYIIQNQFIYNGASLATIYDSNSPRDPDYFKNYRVLKTKYVYLKNDDITGETAVKQLSLGLKLKNFHVRTNDNDPTLSMGQIVMLVTADRGNLSGGTTSTLSGVPIQGTSTGCTFRFINTSYFYDN